MTILVSGCVIRSSQCYREAFNRRYTFICALWWASPETYQGSKYGETVDIGACGCMTYGIGLAPTAMVCVASPTDIITALGVDNGFPWWRRLLAMTTLLSVTTTFHR